MSAVVESSPLRYRTLAILSVRAVVAGIDEASFACPDGVATEPQRAPTCTEEQVQRIVLSIISVISRDARSAAAPVPNPGDRIQVVNPYPDRQPPFVVGDEIGVDLRLVSAAAPHEEALERAQWWFYPPGSTEDITPPREPFEAVKIYGRP